MLNSSLLRIPRGRVHASVGASGAGLMAYTSGAGAVPGAAADLLAAAINQNVCGWRLAPAATEIERNLGRLSARRLGFRIPLAGT